MVRYFRFDKINCQEAVTLNFGVKNFSQSFNPNEEKIWKGKRK